LILEASVELEKNMSDEEVEEEWFDKDEMEEGEEFKEHEVGGPTNLPMKNLESCHANKSKKVMKSPLKKRTKKVLKLVAKWVSIATITRHVVSNKNMRNLGGKKM
jgi:hypothetical protein